MSPPTLDLSRVAVETYRQQGPAARNGSEQRAGEVFRLLLGGLPRALGGDVAKQSANPSGNCEEILRVDEYLCAAAIRAAGGQLLRVEPGVGGGRCSMIFDDAHGKASALLRLHKAGVLKVCSRDYADAVDAVKRELFAARGR